MNKKQKSDAPRIRPREQAIIFAKIILGGALIAVGVQFFLVPNDMVIGGSSGLAIIFHHFTGLSTGVLIFLVNAPMFLLGLRELGLRFTLTALLGLVTSSVLVDVLALLNITVTDDLLLVSIFGGAIMGVGVGLCLSAGSSGGGTDVLARLVNKRYPKLTMGLVILLIDSSIILAGALVFREIESSLYAIISAYILKHVVDAILYKKS